MRLVAEVVGWLAIATTVGFVVLLVAAAVIDRRQRRRREAERMAQFLDHLHGGQVRQQRGRWQ